MLPHLTPDVPNAPLSAHRKRSTRTPARFLSPTAARRRALAVILEDEHHREPEDLDVSAHCAGDNRISGQPAAPQAVPRRQTPACRPPKGRHAARSRMSVLASCGSHPACRCVRLVWRPQAVCVDRATGLVALLPFHVPAVPFAAAVIPPHCSVAAACPCVFTPGQAAQRCALRAPRSTAPLGPFAPQGAGPLRFAAARRRARGSACKTRRGKFPPDPSYCAREACRRRNPPQSVIAQVQPLFHMPTVSQGGRRPEPRCPLRVHRTRGLRRLARTGVAARSAALRRPRGSAVVFFLPDTFLRRPSTP